MTLGVRGQTTTTEGPVQDHILFMVPRAQCKCMVERLMLLCECKCVSGALCVVDGLYEW